MKSLKTIQTLSKVGKILSKIVFICSIIGICGYIIGIIALKVGANVLEAYGATFDAFFPAGSKITENTIYAFFISSTLVLIGEAVVAWFAERYFKRELKDGTPFTIEGSKQMLILGIIVICVPIVAQLFSEIAYTLMQSIFDNVADISINYGSSIGIGVMFILTSVICRYGAELNQNRENQEILKETIKEEKETIE